MRSLARLKMVTDELRMRVLTSHEIGIESPEREAVADTGRDGRVLIVDDRPASYERIAATLSKEHAVEVEADPNQALFHAADGNYDLLIVSLGLENFDALRLCSQIRSLDRTRNLPILAITEPDNTARMLRGLEIGVNDFLIRPIDKNELLARARSQVRKRRYTERLRDNVQMSIEMAITDALTGLFNRRYMESHLGTLIEQAAARGKPLSALVLDIDYFKSINDSHGHDAGDDVLRDFALRIKRSIRGIDLACRYGGEEFVIVMPETDMAVAAMVAERLRRRIAAEPFAIAQGSRHIPVTISIGIAGLRGKDDTARGAAQARRPGALPRQTRRPQSRRARRRLTCPSRQANPAREPVTTIFVVDGNRASAAETLPVDFAAGSISLQENGIPRCATGALQRAGRCRQLCEPIDNPAECSGPPHLLGPWGSAGTGAVRVASS